MKKQSKHILIADDNQTNIILLDRLLRQMGYETTKAYNGQEVIDLLQQSDYDLVLLDIMMPDVTGFGALEWIRTRYTLDTLPVIIISALIDDEDVIKGLELGANDYVAKPIQVDVLQRRVETQLKIKQAADEHAYIQERLRETNDLQNRIMRIASHDLKNPLANIKLILSLLKDQEIDSSYVELASEQAEKMVSIIHEFLELELVKNNSIQVNCGPINYANALKGVLAAFEQAARAKGISIETHLSDKYVFADKNRLEQVLSNLVSNAVKYAQLNTPVKIWDEEANGSLTFYIQNQGEPIPADEIDKLFTPFGKLRPRPTGGEHSSGLGLWIVQQMMHAQQGDVGIDHSVNDGACFWIRLPLCTEVMMVQQEENALA